MPYQEVYSVSLTPAPLKPGRASPSREVRGPRLLAIIQVGNGSRTPCSCVPLTPGVRRLSDGKAQGVMLSGLLQIPPESPGAVWTPALWRRAPSLSGDFTDKPGPKGPPLILEPRKRRALGQLRVKVGEGWESSLPEMRLPEEITQHLQLRERMSVNTFLALAHSSPVGDRSAFVCELGLLSEIQTRLMDNADSLAWLLLRAQDADKKELWLLLLDEEQRRSLVTRHGRVSWPIAPRENNVFLPCWVEKGESEEATAGPWLVPGNNVAAVEEPERVDSSELPRPEWKPGRLSLVVRLDTSTLARDLGGKPQRHPWVNSLEAPSSEGPLFLCKSSATGFKYTPGVSAPAGTTKCRSGDWIQVVRIAYSEGFEEFSAPGVLREISLPPSGTAKAAAGPAELGVDRSLRLATGTEIGELIELRRADRVQTVHRSPIVAALTGSNVDRRIGRSWRSWAAWAGVLGLFGGVSIALARSEDPDYLVFLLLWAGTIASGLLLVVLTLRLVLGPRLWSAFIEFLLPTKKVMAAVQPASPTFAERNCIVFDEDALNVTGAKSGEEVRLHSVVALANGNVSHRIKSVKAHAPTDSEIERRHRLVGGGRHAPIPSAEASLGMASQLPWVWLDEDVRVSLGLDPNQRLQAVIVEPSRRYAFIDSLAEFAIVSALAAVGAITVLFPGGGEPQEDVYTPDGGAVATFGILIAIPFVFLLWRLRRRLK